MTPKRCFICDRRVKKWKAPFVRLGRDGWGQLAWAHFTCWLNAHSPLVRP